MHKHGVDIRHLGRIAKILETYDGQNSQEVSLLQNYISNIMISQAIKAYADQELRRSDQFTERKEILRTIMNDITIASPRKSKFWTKIVPA